MFISKTRLPHILPPDAYFNPKQLEQEAAELFQSAWHFVGTTNQLRKPGDFISTTLLDRPIQIRNFDGELRALSNVCAHRHCLITNKPNGNSPTMRCQYHGWEYGQDGATRKIPEPIALD